MLEGKPKPLPRVNTFTAVPTKRRNPSPFRQVVDPNQLQRASYTIEIMLDMHQKQIEFEIVNQHDIPVIFDILDWYLNSIKENVEMGMEVFVNYAKRVLSFREAMYLHYYRYMMNHPVVKDTLFPGGSSTNNLIHLVGLSSGIRQETIDLDPLRAKANPPYAINDVLPKSPDDVEEGADIERTFGLSAGNSVLDAGDDFNFSDFITRK
jgi:hypothetical protein